MDQYEINLKDYLKVLWERKWIILGITTIALAAGALFSSMKPNEYEATAMIRWQASPPSLNLMPIFVIEGVGLQLIDEIELMTGDEVAQLLRQYQGAGEMLSVQVLASKELIVLRLWGPRSPKELEDALAEYINRRSKFFKEESAKAISENLAQFERSRLFFQDQQDQKLSEIHGWIEARTNLLQTHRERLTQEMEQLLASTSSNGNLSALYYADLASRLQAIDQELVRLEADQESALLIPGYGYDEQLANIQKNLQFSELLRQSLQNLIDIGWEPLSVIDQPVANLNPIGPSRSLNVAIAGVLGLLMGLIAAFILNYLQPTPTKNLQA